MSATYLSGNRLLDALPKLDQVELAADLELVRLAARQATHSAGAAVRFIDFPIDAVLSVVVSLQSGETVEVGTVGSESFVGSDAVLDDAIAQRTSFCQVEGTVGRMSVERFAARMETSGTFARSMRRNVRASLFSAQQYAACNITHSTVERCARWLAMTEDRVGGPEFTLSNEFLAIMLGEHTGSVTKAVRELEELGAFRYDRGRIRIGDTGLLRALACECYAACSSAFSASLRA